MRSCRLLIAALALAPIVGFCADDAVQKKEPKRVDPSVRLRKALYTELVSLDGKEHTLNELLQLFAKITNENFILDPGLPKSVGETKIRVQAKKGGTVLDALAVALALSGLRYAILDGVVFISTEGRLSDRLLHGGATASPLGHTRARKPMSVGEALTRSQPFDPHQDGFITARNFISHAPWRHWEPPRHNPKTGLTDYPGPPIWMEDPDIGHPRFRYTSTPYFLKPEYLALEQEKQEFREQQERRLRAEQDANAEMLAALVKLLKENPDLKAEDILKKLNQETKKK